MTSAAVGFQCPECVAEGAASTPTVRSRLGARVPSRPTVTLALIALNVVAFGWEYVAGTDAVTQAWAMIPGRVALFDEYYRMFSSMFLHYGLLHIGFNMLVLWMLGPQLEQILGHVRFGVLYLVAGLGGSVAVLLFSGPVVRAGGASGAIFGLMGAYVVVGKALRADISQVIGLIGLNVVLGFVIPGTEWRAHLGGLAVGALVGAIFAFAPARNRVLVQSLGVLAIAAVLVVLVVVRDQSLTQELTGIGLDQVLPYLQ
jgi:membrane associated rhomboid family serine protease